MMYFDNTMRPPEFMRPPGTQHDAKLAERGRSNFAIRANTCTQAGMLATLSVLQGTNAEVVLEEQNLKHWCYR